MNERLRSPKSECIAILISSLAELRVVDLLRLFRSQSVIRLLRSTDSLFVWSPSPLLWQTLPDLPPATQRRPITSPTAAKLRRPAPHTHTPLRHHTHNSTTIPIPIPILHAALSLAPLFAASAPPSSASSSFSAPSPWSRGSCFALPCPVSASNPFLSPISLPTPNPWAACGKPASGCETTTRSWPSLIVFLNFLFSTIRNLLRQRTFRRSVRILRLRRLWMLHFRLPMLMWKRSSLMIWMEIRHVGLFPSTCRFSLTLCFAPVRGGWGRGCLRFCVAKFLLPFHRTVRQGGYRRDPMIARCGLDWFGAYHRFSSDNCLWNPIVEGGQQKIKQFFFLMLDRIILL